VSQPPQLLRQSLGIRIDSEQDWDEVARDAQLANQIMDRIPVLKAAKLNEVGSFRDRLCRTAMRVPALVLQKPVSAELLSSPLMG